MYFSINGAEYWYETHGKGKPLVLLHGFTGSTTTWSEFVANWSNDLQIITIDLPGHGRTKTRTSKTMEECCKDLLELANHLNLDSFSLLGYSMGGRTALSFAMLYPEKISSLILESASPGLGEKSIRSHRIEKDEELAQKLEREGIESFVDFWEKIPLFHTQRSLPTEVLYKIREERSLQSAEGLAQSLRFMGTGIQPSWWEQLDQLSGPVLLLAGEHDEKFIDINKLMEKRLYSGELVIIKGAGHAIHVEQAEKFGRIVTEFIFSKQ
ncbi:2-succinyl-6-hydroxy-2,4-cyclohexadiene-1-carboxylate synthase [Virgibacillus sp. C22-A2]|uniref:Putative 2-succinyl-6-hydroxy-2,4-cyclohexadiene-1-carboxylate synthase n=1 Tax=Virgibacillus tibetensis TaxID=3042313 RepID=A0ABU6KKE0_9BACI|nr:2-succinyl-6-hydroxy-2,4-cyclohexadiene-1-carboxylate synthase [Virgibacillus sp. C22-A2]